MFAIQYPGPLDELLLLTQLGFTFTNFLSFLWEDTSGIIIQRRAKKVIHRDNYGGIKGRKRRGGKVVHPGPRMYDVHTFIHVQYYTSGLGLLRTF